MTVFALRFHSTQGHREAVIGFMSRHFEASPREHFALCRECGAVTPAADETDAQRIDGEHQCRAARSWQAWTPWEDDCLRNGWPVKGRSARAISDRRKHLGLVPTQPAAPPWTPDEDRMALAGITPPNRTAGATRRRRSTLTREDHS